MEENNLSPQPLMGNVLLTFPQAIQEVMEGRRVTRESWGNLDEFGFLYDGFLTIHTKGSFHRWLVSDGDMLATDWLVVKEAN